MTRNNGRNALGVDSVRAAATLKFLGIAWYWLLQIAWNHEH